MKFVIIAVGKLKEGWMKAACDEYLKRLSLYARTSIIEVKTSNELSLHIPARHLVWKLDEHGQQTTSVSLAQKMKEAQNRSYAGICLLLGGPDGFTNMESISIDFVWSLSLLTFPYQFARLIVLEQVYRAHSILKGEPYHRQ